MFHAVLESCRQAERERTAYITCDEDAAILSGMLDEINQLGYNFHYLVDLLQEKIYLDMENIIKRHIMRFIKEGPRGYLVGLLDINKEDTDKLILNLYQHFRESKEFIALPGKPAPAHIYTRYDNSFARLKRKRIDDDLISVIRNPRDAAYLPLTLRMLARHRHPDVYQILLNYLDTRHLTHQDFGIEHRSDSVYYPPFEFMRSELRFTAIAGLQYYPSEDTMRLLNACLDDPDRDIQVATQNSLKKIQQKRI